ncbi:endocuticle structural glycoprotein SgAbd-8-like [Scylla paramamosain]|uniref:endocuticle structural glycoprotein SgAbd-8-like n=1 Tax=Scylla paramamosain TaxID=85552 RepID=UPI003083BA63
MWCRTVLLVCAWVGVLAQTSKPRDDPQGTTTVVPILRHINKLNGDGSYTYGFEAADGTFKLETRDALGNVKGKFGYTDNEGKLKVVEYAAGNGTGFETQSDVISSESTPPSFDTKLLSDFSSRRAQRPQKQVKRQQSSSSPFPPPLSSSDFPQPSPQITSRAQPTPHPQLPAEAESHDVFVPPVRSSPHYHL